MNDEEKVEKAKKLKNEGNTIFQNSSRKRNEDGEPLNRKSVVVLLESAISCYQKAAQYCNAIKHLKDQPREDTIASGAVATRKSAYNNMALCYNKLGKSKDTIRACQKVLEWHPRNGTL